MTLDPNDLRTYPVQEKPCKTCPFSGEKPLPLSPLDLTVYYENLMGNGQHINVGSPSFVGKRVKLSSTQALNRVTELLFCPVKQFVIGGISAQYPRLIAFFSYRNYFTSSIFITRLPGHFF